MLGNLQQDAYPSPMNWDVFNILEQALIVLTIGSQIWIAIRVILYSDGAERHVRIMAFCSGLLLFLLCRTAGVTFADLMLTARIQDNLLTLLAIGGLVPFLVGVAISEATVIATQLGNPVWTRVILMVAAFTTSQAAYTNYVALSMQVDSLERAFIPNLCYASAIGIWLTFRFREMTQPRQPT